MLRTRFLLSLLALGLAVGCKAQLSSGLNPSLNRRIEVMVRAKYNVPPNYVVSIGARKPSKITGYDKLPVTIFNGSKSHVYNFLLSNDGKTLARLEIFDLAHDPAFNIDVADRPIRGNPAAKVTVISFDDLECPYCARMHEELFPSTLDRYKGEVRYIYKDFPLVSIHPWAMQAAVDANCLADQSSEAYWNYLDYVHSHDDEINGTVFNLAKSMDALNRIARQEAAQSKLDEDKLDACITIHDESKIRASIKEGKALNVDGTPALFVNGERIDGLIPKRQLWEVIDRALRAEGIQPPPMPAPAKSASAKPASAMAKVVAPAAK